MKKSLQVYTSYAFCVFLIIYSVLLFAAPINKAVLVHYGISMTHFRLIQLSVIVPEILIWSAAFYGFLKFFKYGQTIIKDKDGPPVIRLSYGIGILGFLGVFFGITSLVLGIITYYHPSFIQASTITGNYLSLLIPFLAFNLIFISTRNLANLVDSKISTFTVMITMLLLSFVAGVFVYLLFHNLPNALHLSGVAKPSYYLSNWALLLTLAVPYIYIWFIGSFAVINLLSYYMSVKGTLYKKSLKFLAIGIFFLIISQIILQCLTTLSGKLFTLKLHDLLLVIYPLLILLSIGYIFIFVSAKKLQKIEDV